MTKIENDPRPHKGQLNGELVSLQWSGLGFIARLHPSNQVLGIVRVPVEPGEDKTQKQASAAKDWLADIQVSDFE